MLKYVNTKLKIVENNRIAVSDDFIVTVDCDKVVKIGTKVKLNPDQSQVEPRSTIFKLKLKAKIKWTGIRYSPFTMTDSFGQVIT